jgi:cell division protein ZapE
MSAAVPAAELYIAGQMSNEFARTVSRIQEMQSAEFLALSRRDVDTSLT